MPLFRRRLPIAVPFVMVLWTPIGMFFLALSPGIVIGTALLQLHETWEGVDDQSFSWDRRIISLSCSKGTVSLGEVVLVVLARRYASNECAAKGVTN